MFDKNRLEMETIGITSGPWERKGFIIFKATQPHESIVVCKTEADSRAIVALRNSYEDILKENEELKEETQTGIDPEDYEYIEEKNEELESKITCLIEHNIKLKNDYIVLEEKFKQLGQQDE